MGVFTCEHKDSRAMERNTLPVSRMNLVTCTPGMGAGSTWNSEACSHWPGMARPETKAVSTDRMIPQRGDAQVSCSFCVLCRGMGINQRSQYDNQEPDPQQKRREWVPLMERWYGNLQLGRRSYFYRLSQVYPGVLPKGKEDEWNYGPGNPRGKNTLS